MPGRRRFPVLYPANAAEFSTFGLGVLTDTVSCEVTVDRNGVFECLLKYPIRGQHYGLITKECIIKAKPNDTASDQAFRIYHITKPRNRHRLKQIFFRINFLFFPRP